MKIWAFFIGAILFIASYFPSAQYQSFIPCGIGFGAMILGLFISLNAASKIRK